MLKKSVKYGLILLMLFFSTGCVDLFYAKDFTCREFIRDHIQEPFGPLSDLFKNGPQDPTGDPATVEDNT